MVGTLSWNYFTKLKIFPKNIPSNVFVSPCHHSTLHLSLHSAHLYMWFTIINLQVKFFQFPKFESNCSIKKSSSYLLNQSHRRWNLIKLVSAAILDINWTVIWKISASILMLIESSDNKSSPTSSPSRPKFLFSKKKKF